MNRSKSENIDFFIMGASIILYSFNQWIGLIGFLILHQRRTSYMTYGSSSFLLKALFSLSFLFFTIFSVSNGEMTLPTCINIFVSSILMFNIGCSYINYTNSDEYDEGYLMTWLLAMITIGVALALPHIPITVYDIFVNGLINPNRSLAVLDDERALSTTLRVIDLSLSIGYIAYAFQINRFGDKKNIAKCCVALSIISLLCSMHYVSRTGISIFAISIIFGFLSKKQNSFAFKNILLVAVIIFFADFFLNSEMFQVYKAREKDYSSFSNFGGRSERWLWAWNSIKENPLGTVGASFYAHNLWLDYGKDGGIIPFVTLVLFSLINIFQSIKVAIRKRYPSIICFSVALYSLIFFMCNFTECIHEGIVIFLIVYCFFCGSISKLAQNT